MGKMRTLSVLLAFMACIAVVFTRDCLTHSCLRRLYNSYVVSVEKWRRPLGSSGGSGFGSVIPHAGVVVRLRNGERWLIHKGSGYGEASDTVITDANYMSHAWTMDDERNIDGCWKTVDDFMVAGGVRRPYNLLLRNCLTVTNDMWALAESC